MSGYTRQSVFATDDTITSDIFNDEYNQLVAAFHNQTGHKHDGTAAEGPVIGVIGDAGLTTPLNKVLIDTVNDNIGFWVDVASASVEQVVIQDGAIVPVTNNDIDLGIVTTNQFKAGFFTGTVTAGAFSGPHNGTVGATTPAAGTFTALSTTGSFTSLGIDDNATAKVLELSGAGGSELGTWTKDAKWVDNGIAYFGTGNDLRIYHDGSNSFISDQGTGALRILSNQVEILNAAGTENILLAAQDGAVKLYYDGNAKLETSSGGITVTGAALPNANDGGALGDSGTGWSDLFLASGGVVNWNAGNYTLTHSAGLLTASGALTVSGAFTSLGIDDNATGELWEINGSTDANGQTYIRGEMILGYNNESALATRLTIRNLTPDYTAVQLQTGAGVHGYLAVAGGGFVVGSGANATMKVGHLGAQALQLITDNTARVTVMPTTGYVGLGTTTAPDGMLHVHEGSAGTVTASASANIAVFEAASESGISVLGPDASTMYMGFGSPTNNIHSYLEANYTSGLFTLGTTKVGSILRFKPDNQVLGLTLSGASGSELAAFAGNVTLSEGKLSITNTATEESISLTKGTVDAGFFDFVATEDADTTSALSSLSTPGSIEGWIQIEVNGTKKWLPYYGNPS